MKNTHTLVTIVTGALLMNTASASEWEQSFDMGATLAKGNSDSVLVSAGYAGSKKLDSDEYALSANYTYGEDADSTTNDELLASAFWNHLFNDAMYAGTRVDLRTDALADIDYRTSVTGLVGCYLVKNDTTSLAIEGGLGYTFEQVAGTKDDYVSLYVGQRFEHDFNDKTRLYQTFGIKSPFDDTADYSIVAELGVETALSETLSLKVYIQDKYEAQPAAGADKNDFKLVTGISYKF